MLAAKLVSRQFAVPRDSATNRIVSQVVLADQHKPCILKRVQHSTQEVILSEYMTTAEVATYTGIPAATLRYWRHVGHEGPPSFCLGPRRVVYRKSAVEAWISAQETATARGGGAA